MGIFKLSVLCRRTGWPLAVMAFAGCAAGADGESANTENDDDIVGEPTRRRFDDAGTPRGSRDAGRKASLDAGAASDAALYDAGRTVTITVRGDVGAPVADCPAGLICNSLGLGVSIPNVPDAVCLRSDLPPQCPESLNCAEIGMPGARCISVEVGGRNFSYCEQACMPPLDAGSPAREDAGALDAGRDAGSRRAQ